MSHHSPHPSTFCLLSFAYLSAKIFSQPSDFLLKLEESDKTELIKFYFLAKRETLTQEQ